MVKRMRLVGRIGGQEIKAFFAASTASLGFYIGVIVLAIFAPRVAAFGFLVIAIVAVLRVRGDQTRPTQIAGPA